MERIVPILSLHYTVSHSMPCHILITHYTQNQLHHRKITLQYQFIWSISSNSYTIHHTWYALIYFRNLYPILLLSVHPSIHKQCHRTSQGSRFSDAKNLAKIWTISPIMQDPVYAQLTFPKRVWSRHTTNVNFQGTNRMPMLELSNFVQLGCVKHKILFSEEVWRIKAHHHAKFCQNWSIHSGDIAIFTPPSWIFWILEILLADDAWRFHSHHCTKQHQNR